MGVLQGLWARRKRILVLLVLSALGLLARWHFSGGTAAAWTTLFPRPIAQILVVFPDTTVSSPMVTAWGFRNSQNTLPLGDFMEARLLYEEATKEATAERLRLELDDDSIALVVGHESSTTALYLIDEVYGSNAARPMPLILVGVTNPAVLRSTRPEDRHIMRIPASDEKQIETLALFLRRAADDRMADAQNSQRNCRIGSTCPLAITLLVDQTNPAYSNYIAKEFISKASDLEVLDSLGVGISENGFDPKRLLSADPDMVLFIGMEVQADIFLRRVKAAGTKLWSRTAPEGLVVVFTDGVAGSVFDNTRKVALDDGESIFLSGPFDLERSCKPGCLRTQLPDYSEAAKTSRAVAEALLRSAGSKGKIDRQSVLKEIRSVLSTPLGVDGISFDETGQNVNGAVHIFRIEKSAIYHAEQCPCRW